MGLREQAAADLKTILEDDVGGFGWAITITPPNGGAVDLKGFSTDVGETIDPDTGQAVAGRTASVALRIATLLDAGLELPAAVVDSASKPWVVEFLDIDGSAHAYKVMEVLPDRAIGCVVCRLEVYESVYS